MARRLPRLMAMLSNVLLLVLQVGSTIEQAHALDAVTMSYAQDEVLVPVREVCQTFDLPVKVNRFGVMRIAGKFIGDYHPFNPDNTVYLPARDFKKWALEVTWDKATRLTRIAKGDKLLIYRIGEKSVSIDKSKQLLFAKQGDRVVMKSKVSTGKFASSTPNGSFKALSKQRVNYSSLYDNAPMPFSVQVVGTIFIHGYKEVPDRPASHGCIRLPLPDAAEFFFDWVEVGTPIKISGQWKK